MIKIIELFFVFFAKIYIYFYKDKNENWSLFPPLILTSILTINLQTLLYCLEVNINGYFYAGTAVFFIIFFTLFFRSIKYDYVVNYKISTKKYVILIFIIFTDLIVNFILANISRNGKFLW